MSGEVTGLASGVRLAYKVTCCALERRRMKKEDEVIAQEREKETPNVEAEGDCTMKERINHFKHDQHGLVMEKDSNSNNFTCGSCGDVGQGKRYICEQKECKFEMHLHCAIPPVVLSSQVPTWEQDQIRMKDSTAHKEHQVKEIYKNTQFTCTHCKTSGNGGRFHCNDCDIELHQVCAENPTKITSFMHPNHELELRTKHVLKACSLCRRVGDPNTRMYGCDECRFYLHPTCSQWPQYLVHQLRAIRCNSKICLTQIRRLVTVLLNVERSASTGDIHVIFAMFISTSIVSCLNLRRMILMEIVFGERFLMS